MHCAQAATRVISVVLGTVLAAVLTPAASATEDVSAASYCVQEVSADELSRMNIVNPRLLRPMYSEGSQRSVSTMLLDGTTKVEIKDRTLQIIDPSGMITKFQPIFSGYDIEGWFGLHVLADGWLYANRVRFDSILRIERRDGRWTLSQNIRVRERDADMLNAVLRWLEGKDGRQVSRDRLTGLIAKGDFRFYSPALRLMLFLEDGEKFQEGQFLPIGKEPMRRYYGDLATEKVALLRDFDGKLHSYDGHTLVSLEGPAFTFGLFGSFSQPTPGSRTFLGNDGDVFEVRGAGHGSLRLAKLPPTDGKTVGWFLTVVLNDDKLLFVGGHAIYELVGDELRPIWKPDGEIISGSADANKLADGKLVITTRKDIGAPVNSIWLLAPCQGR